jgi:hypothetical protein
MSIDAMKTALGALDWAADHINPEKPVNCDCPVCVASDALRLAIEQAEKQEHHAAGCALLKIPSRDCDCQEMREPVAWRYKWPWNDRWHLIEEASEKLAQIAFFEPLYTAPPQRQSLTDEELRGCFLATNTTEPLAEGWPGLERFARAIERAHGIGGGE